MQIYGFLDHYARAVYLMEREDYDLDAHKSVRSWRRGDTLLPFVVGMGSEEKLFGGMQPFVLVWDECEYILPNDVADVAISMDVYGDYSIVVDGAIRCTADTIDAAIYWIWRNGYMPGALRHMRSDLIF